jgi:hypothetical protein
MSAEIEILDKRIKRLEGQNRRLKLLGFGFAVFALATAAFGQTTKGVIAKAQKFELRDDNGHLRAELAILNGGPVLRFFDEDENVKCLLAEDSLNIFKKGGDTQAVFRFNGLSFGDGQEKTFVMLDAYGEDQMGKLKVNDYQHKVFTTITAEDLVKLHPRKTQ